MDRDEYLERCVNTLYFLADDISDDALWAFRTAVGLALVAPEGMVADVALEGAHALFVKAGEMLPTTTGDMDMALYRAVFHDGLEDGLLAYVEASGREWRPVRRDEEA
jgi:hypothetical protein